jgi:chromosome segregation ATPase
MYENHREKAERDIERYEREMDKVNKRMVELESQNFAL